MSAIEWVRPGGRPEWGRGDVEWWFAVDDAYRLPTDEERDHRCTIRSCPNLVHLVRLETITRWDTGTSFVRRSFRCHDHIYSTTLVEGGRVLTPRPRFPEREA